MSQTQRTDANGRHLDHRMHTTTGNTDRPTTFIAGVGQVAPDTGMAVPTGLGLTAGDGQLAVAFDAVSGTQRYGIQYRRSDAPTDISHTTSPTNSKVLMGLTNDVDYEVRVRTESADGKSFSAWSSWVEETPAD